MRKPGTTRQEVIHLKSLISLKLRTNVRFGEKMIMAKDKVEIFYSLQVRGTPSKNGHFSLIFAYLISCLQQEKPCENENHGIIFSYY